MTRGERGGRDARRSGGAPDGREGRRRIIVAGAGIGGLTAALCLARTGNEVTVLERAAEPRESGAGILLMNNGLAVLDGLGFGAELRAAGNRVDAATLHGADGRPLTAIAVPDRGPGLDHALMLRRSALHGVLLDAARRQRGLGLRFGAPVVAGHPSGRVTAEIAGVRETFTADLVVAADGVRSVLRGHGRFGARFRDLRALSIRGMVPVETPALTGLDEYWSPAGVFGGAPMGDGSTYFFTSATKRPLPHAVGARDLAAFRAVWRQALPTVAPVLEHVREFGDLYVTGIARVDCERWVDGRLVLLGDAAHAMPPNLGQGGSSAIIDGAVLAHELAADRPLAEALARYDARRRPVVRALQDKVGTLFRLTEAPPPGMSRVYEAAVRLASRVPRSGGGEALLQEDPAWLHAQAASMSDARLPKEARDGTA
ncbi:MULTISPECIES: FAD-dependent oxidoreductase [Actinomadura]|uniref:FAD-dependent oxidoreductase n=2 Tax=Actinomadura yumaensis TaxID=111807 RepID=A0ABW2CNS7_9ACTN|nr:NAD(P)/FAD-dependent oxidoreductase [Actinomadura sp. J1-007]MWK36839.1 NAD(P)-binding protein [Actinomadura sp. J1-007]